MGGNKATVDRVRQAMGAAARAADLSTDCFTLETDQHGTARIIVEFIDVFNELSWAELYQRWQETQ
jgi:hypothetical protein